MTQCAGCCRGDADGPTVTTRHNKNGARTDAARFARICKQQREDYNDKESHGTK